MPEINPVPNRKALEIRARLSEQAETRQQREEARRAGMSLGEYQNRHAGSVFQERLNALEAALNKLAQNLGPAPSHPLAGDQPSGAQPNRH